VLGQEEGQGKRKIATPRSRDKGREMYEKKEGRGRGTRERRKNK
jgi:hypothetical protein